MSPRPKATSDADLLAAAYRVVMRVGPSLTLSDVAKEAKVSPATLVQRFGSKRGLLLALFSTSPAGLADEFARIRQNSQSALAAVYATGDCMAAMAQTPEMMANSLAFLQMDLTDPDFHRHAQAHSRETQLSIKALLDEAVADGDLVCRDTARLARAVQTMMAGSLLQWAIDREGKVNDRVRGDLETLLKPWTPSRNGTRERGRRTPRRRRNGRR
jgi:AcrR family transcriptional regulator